jgi:hypothetical protein
MGGCPLPNNRAVMELIWNEKKTMKINLLHLMKTIFRCQDIQQNGIHLNDTRENGTSAKKIKYGTLIL